MAREPLLDRALDLAWSHWTGLGVRGTSIPPETAVDPEALIYFTASVADLDPRLRDEATGWWRRFQHHVSRPRLTRLAASFSRGVVAKFEAMTKPTHDRQDRGDKARLEHLDHPARALLRLRCVFGATARAEILLALLTEWSDSSQGATALALSEVGYSKRNIALVLEDLRLGGLLVASSEGNRVRFRVADPQALASVLSPLPSTSGRWHLRLPIVADFVELARELHGKDARVQSLRARKRFSAHARTLEALGLKPPSHLTADTYWSGLQEWLSAEVLQPPPPARTRFESSVLPGLWIAPDEVARRPLHLSSGVLPRPTAHPAIEPEFLCLDLVQVPTVDGPQWTWAVLSEAATSTYRHTIGLSRGEAWRFVTWQFGQPRFYAATYAAPLPHAQISAVYGEQAASRARRDRPAVELRLTRLQNPTDEQR